MIISIDRNPKYSLYYIGGLIVDILAQEGSLSFDIVIKKILSELNDELSIDYIYFSFDWLYLLSLIEIKNDKVMLCK